MGRIKAGVCLHLKVEGYPKPHLHIVLTEPYGEPPTVAIVSLRTYKDQALGLDDTVVLEPGPGIHRFVTHKSFVFYKWARPIEVARLERLIDEDLNTKDRDDCSAELLAIIREGLFRSPYPKRKIQDFCQEAFDAEQVAKPIAAPATPKRDL
jgi:hypothetical protein